jgi:WD40 repeat protein
MTWKSKFGTLSPRNVSQHFCRKYFFEIFRGHCSNVFATLFFPHKSDNEVISGSNDSEIRHYSLETGKNKVYAHHKKKVLSMCINQHMPDTFISCSADGTARIFDIRKSYANTRIEDSQKQDTQLSIIPQGIFNLKFI